MASVDSMIGRTLGGKYKILELLGQGGMAEVYKAHHETLDRFVAVKVMHSFLSAEQDFLGRFQREARAMAALNHPGIVNVFDFDIEGNMYYIVMEYISGGTLKEAQSALAHKGTKMSLSRAVQIILELSDALAYAHSRGMLHRDIKPANIMINERDSVVLTDFGIAKILTGPSYTATGAMIGTPAYMSPEQGIGQPGDERSDLYSLSILFYQLVTGQLPYDADTPLAVVLKHVNDPVPIPNTLNTAIPNELNEVIMQGMAKDPDDRYGSMHQFARAVRQAVQAADIDLAAVPDSLLQDRPTPLPSQTIESAAADTVVAPNRADRTQVAAGMAATVVADGGAPTVVADGQLAGAAGDGQRRFPIWMPIVGGLVVVALIVGGLMMGGVLGGGGAEATATQAVAAVIEEPEPTETEETEPTETSTPRPTVNLDATVDARLTEEAPTQTLTPTPSETPTETPTPSPTADLTAEFLSSCETALTLDTFYTSPNQNNAFAIVGSNLTMNLVIENTGGCTIPAGLELRYVDGIEFDQSGSGTVVLEESLAAGEQVTLQIGLVAPETATTYEASWALFDENDEQIGDEFEFQVIAYVPATATPVPTNTPVVAQATAPPAAEVNVQFNTVFNNCTYPGGGIEYRCQMIITPYGGAGDTYTTWVFDSEPAARYFGQGNQVHFITARRCSPWIHEVRVQDEASGEAISRNVFFDPTTQPLFPSGNTCSET